MEATAADDLRSAYQEFVAAAAVVLEARGQSGGEKTAATDTALEAFKHRWELFRVSCDHAKELVESIRQRIGSECLVDKATGSSSTASASAALAAPGIKPISAVRLEQMSKAVRWLVIELQHGAGGPSAAACGARWWHQHGAGGPSAAGAKRSGMSREELAPVGVVDGDTATVATEAGEGEGTDPSPTVAPATRSVAKRRIQAPCSSLGLPLYSVRGSPPLFTLSSERRPELRARAPNAPRMLPPHRAVAPDLPPPHEPDTLAPGL